MITGRVGKKLAKHNFHNFILAATVTFIMFSNNAYALHVPFKRIVFDAAHPSDVLTVINDTDEEKIYVLDWLHYRMEETGGLKKILKEEKGEGILWAEDMIRFETSRFTLPPRASREVRLFWEPPAELKSGEYRAHLQIRTQTLPAQGKHKNQMRLTMEGGIVMPVFVRQGAVHASAEISNVKLTRKEEKKIVQMQLTLKRNGNMSLYGEFLFACLSGEKKTVIKRISGIAVYTEVSQRNLNFNIDLPEDAGRICPYMQASYQQPNGNNEVLSEEIPLP